MSKKSIKATKTIKTAASIILSFAMICSSVSVQPVVSSAAVKAKKITLNKTKLNLNVGDKAKIKVKKVAPKGAGKAVKYVSASKKIAKVNKKGVVTAVSEGKTKVTVTAKSNKKAKKVVKVTVRDNTAQQQPQEPQQPQTQPFTPVNPPADNNGTGGGSAQTMGPVITETPSPVQPDNPVITNEPVITEEPVQLTEEPTVTEEPGQTTEEPAVTEEPGQATEKPVATDEPEHTKDPAQTDEPLQTDMPEQTNNPATEAPATDIPATEAPEKDTLVISEQSEVEKVLAKADENPKVTKVKIATDEAAEIELPEGDYSSLDLIVEAPLADISNHAIFKNVTINEIADDTYREYAKGNNINVKSANGHIIIMETAFSAINILKDKSSLNVTVNGSVSVINVDAKDSAVDINGSVQEAMAVKVKQQSSISSSRMLEIETEVKIDFVVYHGAEDSKVSVNKETAIPNVYGIGSVQVEVGATDQSVTVLAQYQEDINEQLGTVTIDGNVVADYIYTSDTYEEAISGAEIYIAPYTGAFSESSIMESSGLIKTSTDSYGNYKIDSIYTGNYVMMVKAQGLETVMQFMNITGFYGDTFHNETIHMLYEGIDNEPGTIKGTLSDSEDMSPLEGITARLRSGRANLTGEILDTVKTGPQGDYVFEDVMPGYYTIEFIDMQKDRPDGKYITASVNVSVASGIEETVDSVLVREEESSVIRFVLTYDEDKPGAANWLDPNLWGPRVRGTKRYHIYPGNRTYYDNGTKYMEINWGTSYTGSETTTIYKTLPGIYDFYIYNYDYFNGNASSSIAKSDAKVTVYRGNRQILTYFAPAENGSVWHVCSYDGYSDAFTENGNMSYAENSLDVGATMLESEINKLNNSLSSLGDIYFYMQDGPTKDMLEQKYEEYYDYANSDESECTISGVQKRNDEIKGLISDARNVIDGMSIEDIIFADDNDHALMYNENGYVEIYTADKENISISNILMQNADSYELTNNDDNNTLRRITIYSPEGYAKNYYVYYKDASLWEIKKEFDYYLGYDSCTIAGYKGNSANVIIPEYIEGYPVTIIGSEAFARSGIVNIQLPASVDSIGTDAFLECYNLRKVYYGGTWEDWRNLYISDGNYLFETVNRHYNSVISERIYLDKEYEFEAVDDGTALDLSTYKSTSGSGDYVTVSDSVEINDKTDEARSQGTWKLPSNIPHISKGDLVTFRIQGYNLDDSEFRFWIGQEYYAGCTPIQLVNNVEEGCEIGAYPEDITDADGNKQVKNQMAINADPETKAFDVTVTFKAGTSTDSADGMYTDLVVKHIFNEVGTGHMSGLIIKNVYYMGTAKDEYNDAPLNLSDTEILYSDGYVSYDPVEDSVTGTYVSGLAIPLNYTVKPGESVEVTLYGECESGLRMWLADADPVRRQHYRWSDIQEPAEFGKTYMLTADGGIESESLMSNYTAASYIVIKGESYGSVLDNIKISKVIVKKHEGSIFDEEDVITLDLSNPSVPSWLENPPTYNYLDDGSVEINWSEDAEDYASVTFDFDPIDISDYSYIIVDAEGDDHSLSLQDATRKEPQWGNPLSSLQCWGQSYPAKIALSSSNLNELLDEDGKPADYKNIGKICFGKGTEKVAGRLVIKSVKIYKMKNTDVEPTEEPTQEPIETPTREPEETSSPEPTGVPTSEPSLDLSGTDILYSDGYVTYDPVEDSVTGTDVRGLAIPLNYDVKAGESVEVTLYGECESGLRMWLADREPVGVHYRWSDIQKPTEFVKTYILTADGGIENESSMSSNIAASYIVIKGESYDSILDSIKLSKVIVRKHVGGIFDEEDVITLDLSNPSVPSWLENPPTYSYLDDGSVELNWSEDADDYASVTFDFDPIDISDYSYIVVDAEGDNYTLSLQDATRKEPQWGNPLSSLQCWSQSYPAKIPLSASNLDELLDEDGNPADYKNIGKICFGKGTEKTAGRLVIKSVKIYKVIRM